MIIPVIDSWILLFIQIIKRHSKNFVCLPHIKFHKTILNIALILDL